MQWRMLPAAILWTVVFGVLGGAPQAAGAPVTIDFEGLPDLLAVTDQFAGWGVEFVGATVLTAGVSLNEIEFPPRSGVKVLVDDGGPINISFGPPYPSWVGGYFNYAMPVTMAAFGPGGVPWGAVQSMFSSNLALSGDLGSASNELIWVAGSAVAAVTIAGDLAGCSFTLDDLTFATAIPEPASWVVLVSGLPAVAALRRKRLNVSGRG